jgi:hypothetical protein
MIHVDQLLNQEFANGGQARESIHIAPETPHLNTDEKYLFWDSNYPVIDQTRGLHDIREHLEDCPMCVTLTLDIYEHCHGRLSARHMQPAA